MAEKKLKGTVRGLSVHLVNGMSYRLEKDQKIDSRKVNGKEVEFILVPNPSARTQGQRGGGIDYARIKKVLSN